MSSYFPRVHVAWDGKAIHYSNSDNPSSPFHINFRPILRKMLLNNGSTPTTRGQTEESRTVRPAFLNTFAKKAGRAYRLCGKGYGEGLEPLLQVLTKLRAEVAKEDFVFEDYSSREARLALRSLLTGLEPRESVPAGQELNFLLEYGTVLAELAEGDAALTVCFVLYALTYLASTNVGKIEGLLKELREFGCAQMEDLPNYKNGEMNAQYKKDANMAIIACLMGNSSMRSVVEAHAGAKSRIYRDAIYALVPPSKDNIYEDELQDVVRDYDLFFNMRFPEGKDPKKDITPALCITKEDFYTGLRIFCEQKKKDAGRFLDLDQGTNPPPKTRIELARTGQLFSPGDFEIVSRIQPDVFRVRLKSNPTGTYAMKVVTKHIKYILKYVMAEVVVESFIWHPNIVILWAYMFCFLNGQITTLLILQDGGQDLERTALSLNTEDKLGGISKLQDVLGYIVQTNWAIEALHTIGVLHRDIKPSNIVHNKDDPTQVVVIDFNCARLSALENGTQTVNIGTCGFVSGDNEGAAQDLFAMGQTAMVLSSGRTLNLLPQQERISHQLRTAFSDEVSDQLVDLYSKYLLYIMNRNASKRWSSLQALVGSSALQLFVTRGGKGADSLHRLFESIDTLTAIKPKDHREPSDDWKAASNRLRGALIWMLNTKQVIGSIHDIDIGVQIGLEDELPSMDPFVVHEINGNFVNFCIAPETENLTEDQNLNTNDGNEMQTVDVLSTAEHVDSTEATGGEISIEVSSDALSTAKTPRRRNHGGRRRSVVADTREVSKETLVNFIIPDLSTHGGEQTQDVVVLGTTDCQTIQIDDTQGPVGRSNKVGRLPPSASALRILRAFFCTIHKCFVFFLCSIGILNLVVGVHYASIYGSNLIWLPEYLRNGIQVLVTFQECTSEYGQIGIEYITICSGLLLESAKDFWFTSSTGTEGVAAFDEISILSHRVLDEQHPSASCIAGMSCEL